MKIIVANTVGIDSEGWSIIPYHSRWTTASLGHDDAFTYYPRDLGYLSSLLKRDTDHEIKLLDGCLDRMNAERYAERIIAEKPDWLLIENSTRTFTDDARLIAMVKAKTGAKIILTGQHATAFPEEASEIADVVFQGEYLGPVLDFFIKGSVQTGVIPFDNQRMIDFASLPFPEDEDVSRYAYALKADNICEYREIQIYASRGCPFCCVYCVARHAYYDSPKWRHRPVKNVVDEIELLAKRYPEVEGFFFDDEIHNAKIKYVKDLCREIIARGLNRYKYDAMCAYGTFDTESLQLMKEAGYYKVRVGIETASDVVAEGLDLKGKHRPKKLRWFLEEARRVGIKVYGTFTIGGRGATEGEDRKTVRLIYELMKDDLIYDCQVSICTPQPGAPYYDWAKSEGLLESVEWKSFDGGEEAVLSLPGYPAERIKGMRLEALEAFDKGRGERDRAIFAENWPEAVSGIGFVPERVLLFRSSRDWHTSLLIDSIKKTWPETLVAVVVPEKFVDQWAGKWPDAKIYPVVSEGFLSRRDLGEGRATELKSYNADLILIPCNTNHCRGYGNVREIAYEVAGGSDTPIRYVTCEGVTIR